MISADGLLSRQSGDLRRVPTSRGNRMISADRLLSRQSGDLRCVPTSRGSSSDNPITVIMRRTLVRRNVLGAMSFLGLRSNSLMRQT